VLEMNDLTQIASGAAIEGHNLSPVVRQMRLFMRRIAELKGESPVRFPTNVVAAVSISGVDASFVLPEC
jgi:hypothetical protein